MEEKTEKRLRRGAEFLCAALGILGAWWAMKNLLAVVLPFFLGCGLARTAQSLCGKKNRKFRRLFALIWLLFLFFVALFWLGRQAVSEAETLLRMLEEIEPDEMASAWRERLAEITEGSFGGRFAVLWERWCGSAPDEQWLSQKILEGGLSLAGRVSRAFTRAALTLPGAFLFVWITVISAFYFCLDGERIREDCRRILCRFRLFGSDGQAIERTVRRVREAIGRYCRAYGILFSMTALELLIGFLILHVDYALLLALLIAAVDILPAIGVGAVLVPWGIAEMLLGKPSLAIGLWILYGVITLVRQISEPHIVGKSIGLPPFWTLLSVYAGLKLFGVGGMIVSPLVLIAVREWMQNASEKA